MLFYGHCPNSFRPPPLLSNGHSWKKVLQTILASLYTPWQMLEKRCSEPSCQGCTPRPAPDPGEMAALGRPGPENFQECPAPPRAFSPCPALNFFSFALPRPAPKQKKAAPCIPASWQAFTPLGNHGKKCSKPSWQAFTTPPPLSGNAHRNNTFQKRCFPKDLTTVKIYIYIEVN